MAPGKSGIGEVGPWAPTRLMSGPAGGCNTAVTGGMAAIVAFLVDSMGPVVLPIRVSRSGPVPVLTPFKPGPGPVAGLDRLPHGRTGTRTAIDRTCIGPQSGLGPGPVQTVVAVQTGQNRFGLVLDQSSVTQTPGVRRAGQGAGADMPPGKQGSRQARRQIVQRAAATRHQ